MVSCGTHAFDFRQILAYGAFHTSVISISYTETDRSHSVLCLNRTNFAVWLAGVNLRVWARVELSINSPLNRRGFPQVATGRHSLVRSVTLGLLVAFTILCWFGASPFASARGEPAASVALLLPSKGDPRWQRAATTFENRLLQVDPNVNVAVFIAQGAESNQVRQARQAIKDGAKVLVVAPVNPAKAGSIVALSQPKKVVVIALDAPIEAKRLNLFVGFDPPTVGGLQGKYIISHAPNGARIVLLNGPANDLVAIGQDQGFDKVVESRLKFHQLQVAGTYWAQSWST